MDEIDKLLNATKVLRQSIPKLIEVFTMYYGEENREYVEKKFQDMMVLCYHNNAEMHEIIDYLYGNIVGQKIAELVKESFAQYGLTPDESFIGSMSQYTYRTNFNDYMLVKAKQYIEFVKLSDKYKEILKYVPNLDYESFFAGKIDAKEIELIPEELYKDAKELLDSYNNPPNPVRHSKQEISYVLGLLLDDFDDIKMDDMIREGKLDTIHEMCKSVVKKKEEYDAYCENYSNITNIISYLEKEEQVRKKIHDKYFLDFVTEFKDVLSMGDQKTLSSLDKDDLDFYYVFGIGNVLPESLNGSLNIEYFRKEYEDKLADPKTPQFIKDVIIDSRIKFFNDIDIDLGTEYEDYVNDPFVKEKWPSEELIDRIKESFLKHKEQYEEEIFKYYLNYEDYKKLLEEANTIGLLNKGALYSPAFFLQNSFKACVMPNVVRDGDGYRLFSQVSIDLSSLDFLDETIIHELNHVFESSLISCDGESYTSGCGWEIIEETISQDIITSFADPAYGKYTAFNEIINELISQQITHLMHEKGIYLFSNPSTAKIEGGSGYECTAFLAKDFLEEYFDTIIASRRDNNMQLIFDKVGKENFEELNDLFHEYHDTFPGVQSGYLVMDLKANKETELTKRYHSIEEKRDRILENMREYVKNHSTKLD